MRIVFGEFNDRKRLDLYLAGEFPELSRSRIQSLIKSGNILVNGDISKPGYIPGAGDIFDVDIPETKEISAAPENIPLDIVFEDKDVVVVNKPKGMVVHPAGGHYSGTLVNALMFHCGDSLSGIGGRLRPGIVHRIDKDTTGLIIACKNDFAHRIISSQLSAHTIERKYIALCWGNIREDEGIVDMPVGRSKKDRKLMTAENPDTAKDAVTHFKVLERFKTAKDPLTLIECSLETGRTHQIRVHMSYIKHPLAGDELYGRKNDPLAGCGQYLHAAVLGFTHPVTGERLIFEAALPGYFTNTIHKLRN